MLKREEWKYKSNTINMYIVANMGLKLLSRDVKYSTHTHMNQSKGLDGAPSFLPLPLYTYSHSHSQITDSTW